MDLREFKNVVFEEAEKSGFCEYELYFESASSLGLQSFDKEIIKYAESTTKGVNFRGIINGRVGSCYSEIVDIESAKLLISKAKEAALLIEHDDEEFIYGEKASYKNLHLVNEDLDKVNNKRKIDLVLKNEEKAISTGKIEKVSGSHYQDGKINCRIINSKGLDVGYERNYAYAYVGVIAGDETGKYSDYEIEANSNFDRLEASNISEKAVENVVSKMGAKPIPTGTYKIIIKNKAFASLLGTHMGIFNGEVVQKGMSLLKGKIGEVIASPKVNLVDDPHLEKGMATVPFDGEGVPTYRKYIMREGKLETFLHNLKTAYKDGVKTTGNASRGSYKATIGVSHTNAYIEKGEKSLEEIFSFVKDGLYITEFDGLHAGTNAITGDFSLGVRGFLVKEGKKDRPVKQIVASGNFFDLLKDIEEVGKDLVFGVSEIASPSIVVKELSVAGE